MNYDWPPKQVVYPDGFSTARDPQTVVVNIIVTKDGKIREDLHDDPVLSALRHDNIEYRLAPEPGSPDFKFRVIDFQNACVLQCTHPNHPFRTKLNSEPSEGGRLASDEVTLEAAGGLYKSTWVILDNGGNEVYRWDPHVFLHGGS